MNNSMHNFLPWNKNKSTNKKVYEVWKGNNHFFFKGKVYAGSYYGFGLLTLSYILGKCIIFTIFIIKVS